MTRLLMNGANAVKGNRNIFTNKILLASIVVSIGLVLMAIYAPFISDFLAFNGLKVSDWGLVGLAVLIFLFVFEILKILRKKRITKNELPTTQDKSEKRFATKNV